MSIRYRYTNGAYVSTLAEFTASTRVFRLASILMPTDSDEIRISDGVHAFAGLMSLPVAKAAVIAAIGAPNVFTAIGAAFADLPAARIAVNTLRTETLASDTATNAKIDAVIAALKTAGLMDI
jgi:hypothetical protein